MIDVPTILAVFANYPKGSPLYLQSLEEELVALTAKLDELEGASKLIGKPKVVTESKELKRLVDLFHNKIRIFHYGGHANTLSLDTEKTKLSIVNFVEYINLCTKLKLVVLNGCSTRGFVKRLFERTSVQAVIATNYAVGDAACQEFSAEFYRQLLNNETTLETAFTVAVSNFTIDNEFDSEKNIYFLDRKEGTISGIEGLAPRNQDETKRASIKIDTLLDKEEDAVSWGLYITDEKALDWKIYAGDADTEDNKDDLLKQKYGLEVQLLEKQHQIKEVLDDITFYEKTGIEGKERLEKAKAKLIELQKDEARIEKQKIKLIEDIDTAAANVREEFIVNKFSESFFELNYKDQIDIAYTVNNEQQFRGFILQGTPECAVNLLARRIIKILDIHETTVIRYDFESKFRRSGWEELNIQLSLGIKNHDPDGIVKEMVKLYRRNEAEESTQRGFLLLFRNSRKDDFSKKEVREDIIRFWQDFVERFTAADGGRAFDHPIYLFLLDGQCVRKVEDNKYRSARQKEYEENAAGAGDIICIYPGVQPLNEEIIKEWQRKKEFPVKLLLSKKEIDELLNNSNQFFLPAVQEMSGLKIKNPRMKQVAYDKFRANHVDKDFSNEI